jgi:hypothetical protein
MPSKHAAHRALFLPEKTRTEATVFTESPTRLALAFARGQTENADRPTRLPSLPGPFRHPSLPIEFHRLFLTE